VFSALFLCEHQPMTTITKTNTELFSEHDQRDPLASLRHQFELPHGVTYLDGNSLGAMPRAATLALADAAQRDWGQGLIRSWNRSANLSANNEGWIDLPFVVGNKIARLIGANEGEVAVADSTSINLYKALYAALHIAKREQPSRRIVLSKRGNFPTDLYIAESLCKTLGFDLKLVAAEQLQASIDETVAVVMLTHVSFRGGSMLDMAAINALAKKYGALTVWDLAHSAGAVPVDVNGDGCDFAVGCGYKYLNGGPGAPAFIWAHAKHYEQMQQPLAGWLGHADPFAFKEQYEAAVGIRRMICGTPPILSLVALNSGVDTVLSAQAFGGMPALRKKSLALTTLFIEQLEQTFDAFGLRVVTPRDPARRGSQVSFYFQDAHIDGYAVMQAIIARGVIGDFRAANESKAQGLLRFGFAPLYNTFADVQSAVDVLDDVLRTEQWRASQFSGKDRIQQVT
jgi:kynureninase